MFEYNLILSNYEYIQKDKLISSKYCIMEILSTENYIFEHYLN